MHLPEAMAPGHAKSLPGIFIKNIEAIALDLGAVMAAAAQPFLQISIGIAVSISDHVDALGSVQCNKVPEG
jgi:hypothetical protein